MKILVCIKRVPDTAAKLTLAKDGKSINPEGIEYVISIYDELALDEALDLKKKYKGEVIVFSVDPEGVESHLRRALAKGADKAILVKAKINFDGFPIAKLIVDYAKDKNFDIIFFGRQAIDDDGHQVPQQVAHLLKLPRVSIVTALEIKDKKALVVRQIEDGEEIYEVQLPAIFSVQKGINGRHQEKLPSLLGIREARKKPIEILDTAQPESCLEVIQMSPPPARPPGRIIGKGVEVVDELVKLLKEEAKVL
jgi:electron transfer flavoprotein beta subunit